MAEGRREGSLEAPERHPIDWRNPEFYDETALFAELERVFDICHGCRRCFSLCNAFPTLFDLIDESESMEIDGVDRQDYWRVVEHCYLCDLCFMTKCPYVPPHEWNVDFPHLMLRAKALRAKHGKQPLRHRLLTATDAMGRALARPGIAQAVNLANRTRPARVLMEKAAGVHRDAWVPPFSPRGHRRLEPADADGPRAGPAGRTSGRALVFRTCYGRANEPDLNADLRAVLAHNDVAVRTLDAEHCCGMPKLELGDLEAVARLKEANVPGLLRWVEEGWDLLAPVPSCVLMFKQELPLLFPDDPGVERVARAFFDPFEYLAIRHAEGKLDTEFRQSLGKVAYHVACHYRVQNIGLKTREILELVPDTAVEPIERCSGHDGTYAVKVEFHPVATKIAGPVAKRVQAAGADHYASDCPMAGHHIANTLGDGSDAVHPLTLLRRAYGV